MNNITEITGFLNTTLSFFFPAFNKSINLYLAAEKRFNIITSKYIIAKYIIVFTKASSENTNLNPVISASNIFATNIDISCEPNIPIINPTANENIPIRIGVNGGSLEKDLLSKYGGKPTADAMVESARRHVEILEKLGFYDIAISLKASDLDLCIEAYEKASKAFPYPLHLGITEAGTAFSGTVASSIGLGVLLRQGIGDTLRVSLSDDPIQEIKVAKEILKDCKLYNKSPKLIACPTCGRTQIDLIPMAKEVEDFLQNIESDITVAVMGCAVNGPGEASQADIGIAGGINEGILFKKGQIIKKVPQSEIVETLKREILEMVKNK